MRHGGAWWRLACNVVQTTTDASNPQAPACTCMRADRMRILEARIDLLTERPPTQPHTALDMKKQRSKQYAFLAFVLGGADAWKGRDMRCAHAQLAPHLEEHHYQVGHNGTAPLPPSSPPCLVLLGGGRASWRQAALSDPDKAESPPPSRRGARSFAPSPSPHQGALHSCMYLTAICAALSIPQPSTRV